ncbi:putative glycosyl hydrolase [Paramyrothecium foliicola]|nr:putative glycosyl hydrolase [Paramyrothecium foliicola]
MASTVVELAPGAVLTKPESTDGPIKMPMVAAEQVTAPAVNVEGGAFNHYQNLLFELTLEEKVSLLSCKSLTSLNDIPRLNIPAAKISDSISGVHGSASHLEDVGTASFPSSTGLASTWNKELMRKFGERLGVEARHKAVSVVLGPNVNLHRDPRGGRNFETFSEDPLLSGMLAAQIVNGLQSTGVGACVKHFVCNDSETLRHTYDVLESPNSRTMRELYMKAFQYVFRESDPAAVMMAYNKVDGTYCSESPMIKDVLRDSWGWKGCVISDCYGTHSGVAALKAGLDVELPGPSVFRGQKLIEDYANGLVALSDIDDAVIHYLTMLDRTAASHSQDDEKTVISKETSSIARELATEGTVMLKNEAQTLPLDMRQAPRIAVVGDAAFHPTIAGGGSAASHPQYYQRPLDCFKKSHPFPDLVKYARGVNPNYVTSAAPLEILQNSKGQKGLEVDFFNNTSEAVVLSKTLTDSPHMVMLGYIAPGLDPLDFHFTLKTQLTPDRSGLHTIGVQATNSFELFIDEQRVMAETMPRITVTDFLFVPKRLERTTQFRMEAGRTYSIQVVVQSRDPDVSEPPINGIKLCFEEECDDAARISEAMSLAASSDISIIYAGRTGQHESEGFDMTTLELAENQVQMIKSVAAVSPRTVLVLHCGNPIDVSDFIDDVDSVLIAHFPGQEGGQAIADIVCGAANPSGKLATSWPMRLENAPSYSNFPATVTEKGPLLRYEEGLQVGYRHQDAAELYRFPFGFGLSFTTFAYSDMSINSIAADHLPYPEQTIIVKIKVRNTGQFPGYEIVQVYSVPPSESHVWRPRRELAGFHKVFLLPGEEKSVDISILKRDLAGVWDEGAAKWKSKNGAYGLVVHDNSAAVYLPEEESWVKA